MSYLGKLLEDIMCGSSYDPYETENEESKFDKLAGEIEDKEGVSKKTADKEAYAAGVKKYGKQGMEDRAKAGKEKASESDSLDDAKKMGIAAFKKGIKRAPALDKAFLDKYVAGKEVGHKDSAGIATTQLMKAWTDGWDSENLKESDSKFADQSIMKRALGLDKMPSPKEHLATLEKELADRKSQSAKDPSNMLLKQEIQSREKQLADLKKKHESQDLKVGDKVSYKSLKGTITKIGNMGYSVQMAIVKLTDGEEICQALSALQKTSESSAVANIIRQQLSTGILMSCGARNFMSLDNGLGFLVGRGNNNVLKIILNGGDTYDISLYKKGVKVKEVTDVYVDNLNAVVRKLGDF
jgi:hypothetical protein